MLVFGGEGYATRIVEAADMNRIAPVTPPGDLCDVHDLGFFSSGKTFNAWAIDPVPYMSVEDEEAPLPENPFSSPKGWITNWAIAEIEASLLLKGLKLEIRQGQTFIEERRGALGQGRALSMPRHVLARLEHIEKTEGSALELVRLLEDWCALAKSQSPEAAVDWTAAEYLFKKRLELKGLMKNSFGSKHLLAGNPNAVWNEILQKLPKLFEHRDFSQVPAAYQPLVEKKITGWRGHRLFGLEPELPGNTEDRRGQDPLISISADNLLGTESEHECGFSIWLNRLEMARGWHERGQFIRHVVL
ncbi:hypothetical protein ABVF61_08515 [Roseibium sp. HPY-6]|uniref:hypothetical protein n=1 Tax=Roseibium sp. HPY-6 TaxID=3229852 RepID=UPI00338ECC35